MNDLCLNNVQGVLNVMISKTTKTILFASLLVAMILPFSVMSMAEAEQTQTVREKTIEKVKEKIKAEKPPVAQQPKKSANIRLMLKLPEPKGNLTFSTQAD